MSRERLLIHVFAVYVVLSLLYRVTAPPPEIAICDYTPNSFVTVALLTRGSFDLTPFKEEIAPNYLIPSKGRLLSFYPIGASISAIPFYLPFYILTSDTKTDRRTAQYLGQVAASFFCVASACLLFFILSQQIGLCWSLFLTAIYGLGTNLFPLVNKELWQHGPALFWLTLLLVALLQQTQRRLAVAGFCAGMAVLCRPTNVFFLVSILAWLVTSRRWKPVAA